MNIHLASSLTIFLLEYVVEVPVEVNMFLKAIPWSERDLLQEQESIRLHEFVIRRALHDFARERPVRLASSNVFESKARPFFFVQKHHLNPI